MKATLPSGMKLTGNLIEMCTGYEAESIELEHRDVRCMLRMFVDNPDQLHRTLLQLSGRFTEGRTNFKEKETKS